MTCDATLRGDLAHQYSQGGWNAVAVYVDELVEGRVRDAVEGAADELIKAFGRGDYDHIRHAIPAVPVVHPEPGDRADWSFATMDQYLLPNARQDAWDAVREQAGEEWLAANFQMVDAALWNAAPAIVAAAVAAVRADVVLTLQTMAHGRPHYLSPALESTRHATLLEAAAAIEALP